MIYGFLYIFSTALSLVFISKFGVQIPEELMIFLTVLIAVAFFHIVNFGNLLNTYKILIAKEPKLYIINLISAFAMWLGSFLIPIYYSPSITVFTMMGILVLSSSIYAYKATGNRVLMWKIISIAILLAYFYSGYYRLYLPFKFVVMLASTAILGVSAFIYVLSSGKLNKAGVLAKQILAARFWLLLVFSLGLVIKNQSFKFITGEVLLKTLFLCIITLILPIYFSQKSIEKIGATKSATIFGLTPAATLFMDTLLQKDKFDFAHLLHMGISSLTLAAILAYFYLYETIKNRS
ncbi:MAG: hypothetical protein K0R14_861 [Burkholderiales bacterium]|jgi:hypothetical protein|nr:hypothetical protein [Burkholderiales bacterium]